MADSTETALVQRLVRMDEGAWEEFAGRYHRPLLAYLAAAFGANREAAEEAVQMAFVRCVKSIGTFDPSRGGLFTWLKAVAANEWHSMTRRDMKHSGVPLSALPQDVAESVPEGFDHTLLPEEILARKDFQLAVQETLMGLSDRHREVLVMKYVDGLKVSEIAAALGASEKAIESLLTRSREAFAKEFAARAGGLGL